MKIVWTNLITMWLTQIVGCLFLELCGYASFTASVLSALIVGFSFGYLNVPIFVKQEDPKK